MTNPDEHTPGKPLPPAEPEGVPLNFVSDDVLTLGANPKSTYTVKAWPPGTPPGSKLPPGTIARAKSANPPDKPDEPAK